MDAQNVLSLDSMSDLQTPGVDCDESLWGPLIPDTFVVNNIILQVRLCVLINTIEVTKDTYTVHIANGFKSETAPENQFHLLDLNPTRFGSNKNMTKLFCLLLVHRSTQYGRTKSALRARTYQACFYG